MNSNLNSEFVFIPAGNKLEAVARISALTNSGEEKLAPGSTEYKSVVVNLANGLNLGIDVTGTKQGIARQIAMALGGHWAAECESAGQTITLRGLNLLLELATNFFIKTRSEESISKPRSVYEEALLLGGHIASNTPKIWDGKSCVETMREAESKKWRETEWQGWYFEFYARPLLINGFGGGPKHIGNTEFDYALNYVWDLKSHSVKYKEAILNDRFSMCKAIDEGGLGLFVLSGEATTDPEFTKWHREYRGAGPRDPSKKSRNLKSLFTPTRLDGFYIEDGASLEKALNTKMLSDFAQPKQQNGDPRNPKLKMNVPLSQGSDLQVYEYLFKP